MKQLIFLSCFFLSAQAAFPQDVFQHPSSRTFCPGADDRTGISAILSKAFESAKWEYRTGDTGNWNEITAQIANGKNWEVAGFLSSSALYFAYRGTSGVTLDITGYQFRCVFNNNIPTNAATITVTYGELSFTTQPTSRSACPDGEAVFSVEGSNPCRTVSYEWWVVETGAPARKITEPGASPKYSGFQTKSLRVENVKVAHNGWLYYCVLKVDALIDAKESERVRLTVNQSDPPQITPPASASVCAGNTAVFTVATDAAGAAWQWQQRADEDAAWTNISAAGTSPAYSGQTTASLSVANTTVDHNNYQYRCLLTSTECGAFGSNPATLTVVRTPDITQPAAAGVCPGYEVAFEVSAPAGSLTGYQWQQRAKANAEWADITGTETAPAYKDHTTSSLKVTKAEAAHNNYQYRCRLTAGCGTFFSDPAVLTINAIPEITHPVAKSTCPGKEVDFEAAAAGSAAVAYQWQQRTEAGADWVAISDAGTDPVYKDFTTNHLKISELTAKHNSYEYRCQLKIANCGTISSNPAVLTVAPPAITGPSNQSVCPNAEAVFEVSATAACTITGYQWQQRAKADDTWTDISEAGTSPVYGGQKSATLKVNSIAAAHNGYQYRCKILTEGAPAFSSSADLYLSPAAVEITAHPKDSTVKEGNPRASFRVAAKGVNLNYKWQVSRDEEKTWADIREVGSAPKYEDKTWEKDKLQVNEVSISANGYRYRCLVSGTSCTSNERSEKTSQAAKLLWDVSTGIEDRSPNGEMTLEVYPNPALHRVSIILRHAARGNTTVALYNIAGQKVWSGHLMKNEETLIKEIPIGHLINGLYLLKMVIGNDIHVQTKVVVSNN